MYRHKPISQTGWYDGIPNEDYQSTKNFCTVPSLGASGAFEIMNTCPAVFWTNSDLNPDPIPDEQPDESRFDIGTAAHLGLLELEQFDERTHVVDFSSWASKDAQKERAWARERGLTPLLRKQADKVMRMRAALEASGHFEKWIKGGVARKKGVTPSVFYERSYAWLLPEAGIAVKIRPDITIETPNDAILVNYKTTDSAAPHSFEWVIHNVGYHQKEAFYRYVYHGVMGRQVTRYIHLAQETKPPYLAIAYEIGPESISRAAMLNGPAVMRFAMCVKANRWPAYPPGYGVDGTHVIEAPLSKLMQIEERKDRGELQVSPEADATMKALWYAAQAPEMMKLPRVVAP